MSTQSAKIESALKQALKRVSAPQSSTVAATETAAELMGRRRDTTSFSILASRVRRDADQVRQTFKSAKDPDVRALAESIARDGLRAYPEVRWMADDEVYELVTGERRFTAMTEVLGWEEIPVRVINVPEADILWLQLHENIHRKALTPMELAASVMKASQAGMSLKEIATKLCKSETYVQKALTIGEKLHPKAYEILLDSPQSHSLDAVYSLATVPAAEQLAMAKMIVKEGLTQREIAAKTAAAKQAAPKTGKTGRPKGARGFRETFRHQDLTVTVSCPRGTVAKTDVAAALKAALAKLR